MSYVFVTYKQERALLKVANSWTQELNHIPVTRQIISWYIFITWIGNGIKVIQLTGKILLQRMASHPEFDHTRFSTIIAIARFAGDWLRHGFTDVNFWEFPMFIY